MSKTDQSRNSLYWIGFIGGTLIICFGVLWGIWNYLAHLEVKKNGQITIATITRIGLPTKTLYYDVEYKGTYYTSSVIVTKSVCKRSYVGEHYFAKFIPNKLRKSSVNGRISFAPNYIELLLTPLPDYYQDVNKERIRVDSLYNKTSFKRK